MNRQLPGDTLANEQAFSDASCRETTTLSGSVFSRTQGRLPALLLFHLSADSLSKPTCLPQTWNTRKATKQALICLVAAILMVCALLIFSIRKANIDYMCPIAAAWIATALLAPRSTGLLEASVSGSIMTATLISFYVLLWLMLVSEAHERKLPRIFPARPCLGSRTFVGHGGSGMRRLGHRRQSHRSERSKCRKPLGACDCGFNHILRLFALFLKTPTGRLRRNRPR